MTFEPHILMESAGAIRDGVMTTLTIFAVSALAATLAGFVAFLLGKQPVRVFQWLAQGYIQLFRNTPLLVQIYFFYKGLPHFGMTLTPMVCGILALSLQTGAYLAEVYRAALDAIPKEQVESGLALGFTRLQTYRHVVFPQAMGILLPPYGNQMAGLVKNTSLVAFISVPDLFFVVFQGGATHFRYLEFFVLGIALYMGLILMLSALFKALEQWVVKASWREEGAHA